MFPFQKIQAANRFLCLFIRWRISGNGKHPFCIPCLQAFSINELSRLTTDLHFQFNFHTTRRLNAIALHGHIVDGFICEASTTTSPTQTPSTILSAYFGRPVHLTVKGSTPRPCDPTDLFPKLNATAWYQDGYPLLVLSEESIDVLHEEIRKRVGTQGIEDGWEEKEFVIER